MSRKSSISMKAKSRISKVNEKAFSFLCNSKKKNEKANIITMFILILISSIVYALYDFHVIVIDMNQLLFNMIPIVPIIILCLPGTLLLGGLYFLVNFSKKNNDGKRDLGFTLMGIGLILISLFFCYIAFKSQDDCLMLTSVVSVGSTFLVFFFAFVIKKAPYFSIKQLLLLYISQVICVGIFILVLIVISIIIALAILAGVCAAGSDGSSSSSSFSRGSNQKYKIKRDEADPTKGVLLDDNENVLRKDNGNPVKVTNIDEYSHTAKVDDEEVKIEGE
mgnify:CR=1 FL=1